MSTDYKFKGWMGLDENAIKGNLKYQEYEPKKWEETDVDIQITLHHPFPCSTNFY